MDTLSLVTGLRFVDSFFPSGSYAFSSGLEAAVQAGQVRDVKEFAGYVEDLIRGSISQREAVAVTRAWEAQARGSASEASDTDCELNAMTMCAETRMASRQMGRQVVKLAGEAHGTTLSEFRAMIEEELTPGHFPVCMGVILGANGWGREETVAACLYQMTVGFVSAGMKLLPLGQREGQRLLSLWAPWIAQIARETIPGDPLRSWSPVHEIYAMRHARLESRLFRS